MFAAATAALPNLEATGIRPLLEPLYARRRVVAASLASLQRVTQATEGKALPKFLR
jgi:hypothetical protein